MLGTLLSRWARTRSAVPGRRPNVAGRTQIAVRHRGWGSVPSGKRQQTVSCRFVRLAPRLRSRQQLDGSLMLSSSMARSTKLVSGLVGATLNLPSTASQPLSSPRFARPFAGPGRNMRSASQATVLINLPQAIGGRGLGASPPGNRAFTTGLCVLPCMDARRGSQHYPQWSGIDRAARAGIAPRLARRSAVAVAVAGRTPLPAWPTTELISRPANLP